MTKFKDIIFKENVVIHLPEKWMANELLKYTYGRWYNRINMNSHLKCDYWNVYKENTCFHIYKRKYCSELWYKEEGYKVINYNDVVINEKNDNTIIQMKTMQQILNDTRKTELYTLVDYYSLKIIYSFNTFKQAKKVADVINQVSERIYGESLCIIHKGLIYSLEEKRCVYNNKEIYIDDISNYNF